MKYEAYYVIKPKLELLDKLDGYENSEVLTEKVLWQGSEGGRTAWTESDYICRVKLLFLLHIKYEYSNIEEYKIIMEHNPISIESFDKWWKIERYVVEENIKNIEMSIKELKGVSIQNTNKPVIDSWIDNLDL
jgi:hypothetical protein